MREYQRENKKIFSVKMSLDREDHKLIKIRSFYKIFLLFILLDHTDLCG